MQNIQVVDIKTAIMPCVCELKNLTELANIGWVMDFGSECLKPSDRMTSTAIGAVNISPDIKYSFNRKAMPAELREKCSVPSGETNIGYTLKNLNFLAYAKSKLKKTICKDGMPKDPYPEDQNSSKSSILLINCFLILIFLLV